MNKEKLIKLCYRFWDLYILSLFRKSHLDNIGFLYGVERKWLESNSKFKKRIAEYVKGKCGVIKIPDTQITITRGQWKKFGGMKKLINKYANKGGIKE